MRLKYTKLDGTPVEMQLQTEPITIGRSPDSDLIVMDERASRVHCGIRFWDGEYVIRDLKSMNGTYVNGQRIDTHTLAAGDSIRVGSTIIAVESDEGAPGANTAIREIKDEMESGKGYDTLLKEIVADSSKPRDEEPPPPPLPAEPSLAVPVALPPADADTGNAGLMMGPEGNDPRGPRLPLGENGKKRIKIVVKKKFGA